MSPPRRARDATEGDGGPLLALDTATSMACLALGDRQGRSIAERQWRPFQKPAETILGQLGELLVEVGLVPQALGAIVVGIGPGAFTGLRVGLATAKTLAHELERPIVGIETTAALALAAWTVGAGGLAQVPRESPVAEPGLTVVLPAGPGARYVVRYDVRPAPRTAGPATVARLEPPRLVRPQEIGDDDPALVAVDLEGSGPSAATDRGAAALRGLGTALLVLGAARLAADEPGDDVAALVPTYVTLPRGAPSEGVAWSPDLR